MINRGDKDKERQSVDKAFVLIDNHFLLCNFFLFPAFCSHFTFSSTSFHIFKQKFVPPKKEKKGKI